MKIKAFLLTLISFLLLSPFLYSQEINEYKHTQRDFSFMAPGEWEENPYHKDKMIFEMVNDDRDVHVMLWYNGGTEMSCEKYLLKMADFKGLNCGEPFKKELDGRNIWILECSGFDDDVQITNILAAMSYKKPYDKDAPGRCQGKMYNAMHIAQVFCPSTKYADNKEYMDDIVASLELNEQ